MMTIKEEDEDKRSNNGSDTAYFSPEHEADFNDRDDDRYSDSDDNEMYDKRIQMLMGVGFDDEDEDNQPYDLEEEERR